MTYLRTTLLAGLAVLISLTPTSADAQRSNKKFDRQNHVAGKFDYYAVVLSWSPSYCESVRQKKSKRREPQCEIRRGGRPYSFVLHGLWPQYNKRWPENCRTRQRPFVSNDIIRSMLDIMPSKGLIIHEYKKHGTCSGFSPKNYYLVARKLYNAIKIPARYQKLTKPTFVTVREVKQDFMKANPGLKANSFSISCRGSGNRMREIRFCFSKKGRSIACGQNENQRKLCNAKKMFLPPVRVSR